MTPGPAPQRFGDFELFEVLGGSMGIVYRARRLGTEDPVALKLLRHERLLDGEAQARFEREAAALARLHHPHICPLLDSGAVDGVPYLCMPLLSTRPLAAHREPGATAATPSWRGPVSLCLKVAFALDAAHRHGLVHRDVKPSNLRLDDHGEPQLLDFGLAQDAIDRYRYLTRTGQVVGTPNYLAPEQIDSRFGRIDPRTDVYGLGAVLYELLTGSQAFAADSKAELFDRILRDLPPDPRRLVPALPEALAVVVDKSMARRPRHRYASAKAMALDLRALLAGQPIAAERPPRWQRAWRRSCDRPRETMLAVTFAAMAMLLVGASSRLLADHAELQAAGVRSDLAAWSGRLQLARSSYLELPPARAAETRPLRDWLREHGQPLLAAPPMAREFVPELTAFASEAVVDVAGRIDLATQFAARIDGADRAAWSDAATALAADARFLGVALLPQPGLVPLGADPDSGLQEFYVLASGEPALPVPARDQHGSLQLLPEHGIVLVLLPGGSLPAAPTATAAVTVAPYMLGKHELTRAQAARLDFGRDPSRWPLAPLPNVGEVQTLRHPADQLSRDQATTMLRRAGLQLPTLAQWQFALCAGGRLDCDTALAQAGNVAGPADGYHYCAPVGSFAASPFGLYDLVGNVAELIADGVVSAGREFTSASTCGGHFGSAPLLEYPQLADQHHDYIGVRVARSLD